MTTLADWRAALRIGAIVVTAPFSAACAAHRARSSIQKSTQIRNVAAALVMAAFALGCTSAPPPAVRPPNIVIFFVDDMGYADLGAFGSPSIRTPNLDRIAALGQKWTNFYAAAPVCTPSRAGLLTGRLPIRSGTEASQGGLVVFFPFSAGGLPNEEITIAEMLRNRGYATGAIGKWRLGHLPEFLPTRQGFDSYFGIPYSNDMNTTELFRGWNTEIDDWQADPRLFDVPLVRGEQEVERPVDQRTITRRYTEEAVRFIQEHRDGPFFLYLAHNLPHVPLFASAEFEGHSTAGHYADVVEELDWSAGQVVAALEDAGVAENALFVFTSDNGPWLMMRQHSGSAGPLRDGKGTTWEGGMRVPGIFYWPGRIDPGVVTASGTSLDLLPTIAAMTGATLPADRALNGADISGVLTAGDTAAADGRPIFFYREGEVNAVRLGDYKAHFFSQSAYSRDSRREQHDPPLLYNVAIDPGENFNIAASHPDIVAEMIRLRDAQVATVTPVENQLNRYAAPDREAYFHRYQ